MLRIFVFTQKQITSVQPLSHVQLQHAMDPKDCRSRWGFPNDSVVKNTSAIQEMKEMWVLSSVQENPPKEEMATHPGNPMSRGALQASVHRVSKSWIKLSSRAHGLILLNNIPPMFLGLLETPGSASLKQA